MRISVVIATYNRAPLLRTTLARLRIQQFEPGDEVIVVDNASTDDTPGVIARAAAGFPVPFHEVRELTPGKTPAMNAGLARARGDVLALTDDDVIAAEDWMAAVRQVFGDPSIALAGGRVDPWWECPPPAWLRLEEGQEQYGAMCSPLALLHYGDAQELGPRTAVGANLVIRRTVLDALGGFAPHLGRRRGTLLCGEDHDFCQRAVAAGYRCEYRPELRVRHWVPADRMRLKYYLRWFFWSGVTNAMIERDSGAPDARRVLSPYYLRRLATAPISAVAEMLRGRVADAAQHLMAGAFAFGNLTERSRSGRHRASEAGDTLVLPTPNPSPRAEPPGRPQEIGQPVESQR